MGKANKGLGGRRFFPLLDDFREQEGNVVHMKIHNVKDTSDKDADVVSVEFEIVEMGEFFTHEFYRERD